MTRQEFEKVFTVGQVVISGGLRSKLKIDRISDTWFSVIPVFGLKQQSQRMDFDQLGAVIDGFDEINPKRIEPTIQPVLLKRGLKKENTTENYLYGFARAYLDARKDGAKGEMDRLPDELSEPTLYPEGAKKSILVNAYERKPEARAECLKKYGTICRVCKVDLGKIYGDIGQGYIHVHHLNPIAARGGAYLLDPIKDLCPVCPNCHAMLHRRNPPYSPEELTEIMGF